MDKVRTQYVPEFPVTWLCLKVHYLRIHKKNIQKNWAKAEQYMEVFLFVGQRSEIINSFS